MSLCKSFSLVYEKGVYIKDLHGSSLYCKCFKTNAVHKSLLATLTEITCSHTSFVL